MQNALSSQKSTTHIFNHIQSHKMPQKHSMDSGFVPRGGES